MKSTPIEAILTLFMVIALLAKVVISSKPEVSFRDDPMDEWIALGIVFVLANQISDKYGRSDE